MDINLPRNLEVPRRFVAAVDLRPILPADWFCSGDCHDQINCQKTVVDSWLRLRNMESAASEKDSQSFFCDVCDSEYKDGFSLVCGHFYCNQCWLKHSVEQIKNGKAPITCMNTKCERVLELDHTLTFLPYELCLRYEKLVWEKIMMQKDWLYCESCQSVLHVNVDGEKKRRKLFHPAIVCKCGHSHCILCKRSWHWPLSCNVAERYNDVLENYGEGTSQALQRIKINMRKCPFCRTFCERSYGCNHMSCRCGREFCYSCGGSWDNDHYNCDLEKNTNLVSDLLGILIVPSTLLLASR
ncbi:hypothetical protein AB6A40_010874 [Gnathostoma spinigerum]|uniref:RBR-type E3 ubiquitin transferase n=1 Tax=Gnathostoma spinigerum TaxID=75299 RepID=A0ABD6F423_9BILA